MSLVYALLEPSGKFRCYTYEPKEKTDELVGGIWKEILKDEWDVQYITNTRLPSLDVAQDTISWVARPSRKK
jgi:hypothetical protein